MRKSDTFVCTSQADAAFKELKQMLATAPVLALHLEREPMLLYIAATNRVVSVVVVVERDEEEKNRAKAGILPEQGAFPLKTKLPSLPKNDIWRVHGLHETQALL
jgi:hypothetical protein